MNDVLVLLAPYQRLGQNLCSSKGVSLSTAQEDAQHLIQAKVKGEVVGATKNPLFSLPLMDDSWLQNAVAASKQCPSTTLYLAFKDRNNMILESHEEITS